MKKYYLFLKDHLVQTYDLRTFIGLFILLFALLTLNYSIDLEDHYIDKLFLKSPVRTLLYFLLQGGSFLLAMLVVDRRNECFKNPLFWFFFLVCFGIYAFDRGFYGHLFLGKYFNGSIQRPLLYFISELRSLFTIFLPFLLFYIVFDRKNISHFYGLKRKNVDWKPYLVMLAIMLPFIGLFSFTDAFQDTYPMYGRIKGFRLAEYLSVPEIWIILFYEVLYGLDFLNTELFFRGALVFIFVRFFGPKAIYPIAVTYCVCHFGKPPVEAISSFFGGYILGVISLKSENIWGGVVLHAGIALIMEFFALVF
ncbi:MAG: CPBP family intramembrane metalloprotease [Saprospiraceae bacterium]|nr:CPBP family intramembrane metalloprotease [Saprospiraceae bacterium]